MKTILREWKWINTIWVTHPETWKVWEWVERKGTWQVVWALVENISRQTFVLVEQYRALPNAQVIECVAGLVDVWNSPEEAIIKEILEETGYVAWKVEYLLKWPKSPGISTEQTFDYYAQVSWDPWSQQLEASEAGLIVHETHNSLPELKKFLESQQQLWKLISPGIWGFIGKAIADGRIQLSQ
jgi:8-oxo-dGTP pyrophosphatase MutT (NUDIX family)